MANKRKEHKGQSPVMCVIKASVISTLFGLLLVVIISYLLYKGKLDISAVPVTNAVIKVLCACLSGLIAVISSKEKGLLLSALSGIVTILISFIVYSCLSKSFVVNMNTLSDFGIGLCGGLFVGVVYKLIKK